MSDRYAKSQCYVTNSFVAAMFISLKPVFVVRSCWEKITISMFKPFENLKHSAIKGLLKTT